MKGGRNMENILIRYYKTKMNPRTIYAQTTFRQIRPYLDGYGRYLSKKTGQIYKTFLPAVYEDDGKTLRLKWVKHGFKLFEKPGEIMPPTFVMKITYNIGTDLYDIETSFWNTKMEQVKVKRYKDIFWDRLAEPELFFDWASEKSIRGV